MLRWVSVAPFGNPVVPDVYWMLIGSSGRSVARRAARASSPTWPAPATSSSQSSSQKKIARSSARQVRAHVLDHVDVVRRLERRGGEQHPAARLGERVLQLVGAVGRVDVDEDHADLGRGVLQQRPLGVVRAPQPDPVARLEPEREEALGAAVDARRRARRTSTARPGGGRPAPRRSPWAATVRARLAPIVSSSSGMSVRPESVASVVMRPPGFVVAVHARAAPTRSASAPGPARPDPTAGHRSSRDSGGGDDVAAAGGDGERAPRRDRRRRVARRRRRCGTRRSTPSG